MGREEERAKERRSNASAWAEKQDGGFQSTAIKLADGFDMYKLTRAGTELIDILEYRAGPGNPNADEGCLHFEREWFAHMVPGTNAPRTFCCLWENFREACPICDWVRDNARTANPQLLKDLRPKLRHLWNVVDLNSKDLKVMVWDTGHFNRGLGFGEMMKDALKNVARYLTFAEMDAGYSLQLTVKEQTMPGRKWFAPTRIDFIPREKTWPASQLDKMCCLDKCLVHYSYDELEAEYHQRGKNAKKETSKDPRDERPRDRNDRDDRDKRDRNDRDDRDKRYEEDARRDAPDRPRERAEDVRRPREEDKAPPRDDPREDTRTKREEPPKEEPRRETPREEPKRRDDPTAQECGLQSGDKVKHSKHGKCEIVKISGDGTSITIEDDEGIEHRAIAPRELELIKHGKCEIVKISGDGTSITIEDDEGIEHRAIAPRELELIKKEPEKEKPKEEERKPAPREEERRPAAREEERRPAREEERPRRKDADWDDDRPRRRD